MDWELEALKPPGGKGAISDSYGKLRNQDSGTQNRWAELLFRAMCSVPVPSSLDEDEDLLTLSLGQEPRKFQMFVKCLPL